MSTESDERLSDALWTMYDEEFWLWLDSEIEATEIKLNTLKKIRERRTHDVDGHRSP